MSSLNSINRNKEKRGIYKKPRCCKKSMVRIYVTINRGVRIKLPVGWLCLQCKKPIIDEKWDERING